MRSTLAAIDHRLKSLDPQKYSPWLLIASIAVVLILLTCTLLYGLDGPFRFPIVARIWAVSILLVVFSFVGLGISWRTRHSVIMKLSLILVHLAAVILFMAPLFVFLWLVFVMRDH
jgi:hypothetical protein